MEKTLAIHLQEQRENIVHYLNHYASINKEMELRTAQSNPDASSKIGSYANGILDAVKFIENYK